MGPTPEDMAEFLQLLDQLKRGEFYNLHASKHLTGGQDMIPVVGNGPCYDIYLDPTGAANYPSTRTPANRFNNLQAAVNYAEATFTRAVTVWVCPNTASYGNATFSTSFVDSGFAAVYTFAGAADAAYAPSLNRLGTLTVSAGMRLALSLTNISVDNIQLTRHSNPAITTTLYMPAFLNSYVGGIANYVPAAETGPTLIFEGVFTGSTITTVTVDEIRGRSLFSACSVGFVSLLDISEVLFDSACFLGGTVPGGDTYRYFLKVARTCTGVSVNGQWVTDSSSLASAVCVWLHLSSASSGIVVSVEANGITQGGTSLYLAISDGATTPHHVNIQGCSYTNTTGSIKPASGAFQDSTFGPCTPDNLDWSGVTGTGNVFYTTGATPAGGGAPLYTVPGLAAVLAVSNDAGSTFIRNLTEIDGPLPGGMTTVPYVDLSSGIVAAVGGSDGTFTPAALGVFAGSGAHGKVSVFSNNSSGGAGNVLTADGAGNATWQAGGASSAEPYVTIGNTASLTAERALTAGTGISIVDNGANSTVVINATGGQTGPMGPPGIDGQDGVDGEAGIAGAPGPAGATGATGRVGPMGPPGLDGADGDPGPMGLTGATGPAGATGAAGSTGATGPVGPMGPPGIDGVDGQDGADGAPGRGANPTRAICFTFDGGGSTLATGVRPAFQIPFTCNIVAWGIQGDASGTCTIDVTTSADSATPSYASIVGGGGTKPNVAGPAVGTVRTAPASWTSTVIAATTLMQFNLSAVATFKWATITLEVVVL
jgi:hypothetical protein